MPRNRLSELRSDRRVVRFQTGFSWGSSDSDDSSDSSDSSSSSSSSDHSPPRPHNSSSSSLPSLSPPASPTPAAVSSPDHSVSGGNSPLSIDSDSDNEILRRRLHSDDSDQEDNSGDNNSTANQNSDSDDGDNNQANDSDSSSVSSLHSDNRSDRLIFSSDSEDENEHNNSNASSQQSDLSAGSNANRRFRLSFNSGHEDSSSDSDANSVSTLDLYNNLGNLWGERSPSPTASAAANNNLDTDSNNEDNDPHLFELSPAGSSADEEESINLDYRSDPELNFLGLADLFRGYNQRPPTPRRVGNGSMSARSSAAATVATSSAASTRTTTSNSTISYECSVCLENLDQPASIDDPVMMPDNNENNVAVQQQVDGILGTPRGNTSRRGRGGAASGGRGRIALGQQNVCPTDVVATHCGHLYHQICLEKWFAEQGKRTCPSCRKNVPKAKLIRLYPNISFDNGAAAARRRAEISPDINSPRPSTSAAGASVPIPVPSTAPLTSTAQAPPPEVVVQDSGDSNEAECRRAPCLDMKVIHNTLINDYQDLQERLDNIRENDEVKEATIRSLVEDNDRLSDENQRLKRQIEEVAPPIPTSTNKRRRH